MAITKETAANKLSQTNYGTQELAIYQQGRYLCANIGSPFSKACF